MQKVLVTSRSFGQQSKEPIDILTNFGLSYTLMGADFSEQKFAQEVSQYDALIIGAHPFDPKDLEKCQNLKIIAKHGTGLDNIPMDSAKKLGVTVTNVPAMNSNAVADLAFAHILNISRGVSIASAGVKQGSWKTYMGRDVYAKTLGLIGFGAIAKNVAKRASGFSMKVIVFDPFVKEVPVEMAGYVTLCDLNTVIAQSDIISIHAPLTPETKDMFNREAPLKMKKDAILVNTGRGGVVNESDLYDCMKNGHLFGAALDVTELEPIQKDSPLLKLDNVVITPHIGMYSLEATSAVSVVCAKNVVKKLGGQTPDFVIV